MRHSPLIVLVLSLLAAPGLGQEEAAWRPKVDVLVDRWSNDVGRARVERALSILDEHLARSRNRKDGEALLAKARLLLARPRSTQGDQHAAATQEAHDCERAAKSADLAAEALQGERRSQALALGCLASQHRLRAELSRLELVPGSSRREQLMQERGGEVARRREQLEKAAGKEKATQLLAIELQRILTLREIDQLGNFPRPIGQEDIDGRPVDLTAYTGKVLMILFWSKKLGDPELLKEIAELQTANEDFEVLAINLDEKREDMEAGIAELGVSWRHCFDGKGITGSVARAWSVRGLPSGALLDRGGRVRYLDPWRGNLRLAVEELISRGKE